MQCTIVDAPFIPQGSGLVRSQHSDTGKYHLTDIIKYIEHTMGWEYKGNWQADMGVTMEVGFIWEDALSAAFGDRMALRLDEVELDGIVGSPDGIGEDPEDGSMALEEYKCTWKSSRKEPNDKNTWSWMVQIKSYCKMIGVQVAIMRILYLMGNYKGSGPIYRVVRFEFEQAELDANWEMITKHRDQMAKENVQIIRN